MSDYFVEERNSASNWCTTFGFHFFGEASLLTKFSEACDVFGEENRVVDKFLMTLVAKHN